MDPLTIGAGGAAASSVGKQVLDLFSDKKAETEALNQAILSAGIVAAMPILNMTTQSLREEG